jgi:hypothetical protein
VLLGALLPAIGVAQRPNPAAVPKTSKTQVVMLGTGTPGFDIARSGPATAIVVNGTAYLVDFGAGVMRRAQGAFERALRRSILRKSPSPFSLICTRTTPLGTRT